MKKEEIIYNNTLVALTLMTAESRTELLVYQGAWHYPKRYGNRPSLPCSMEPGSLLIEGLPLVAHNKSFDKSCLKAVFRCYGMDYPDYEFHCTCMKSHKAFPHAENHQLHTISALCGYHLENHHHALADAKACAWITREIL